MRLDYILEPPALLLFKTNHLFPSSRSPMSTAVNTLPNLPSCAIKILLSYQWTENPRAVGRWIVSRDLQILGWHAGSYFRFSEFTLLPHAVGAATDAAAELALRKKN